MTKSSNNDSNDSSDGNPTHLASTNVADLECEDEKRVAIIPVSVPAHIQSVRCLAHELLSTAITSNNNLAFKLLRNTAPIPILPVQPAEQQLQVAQSVAALLLSTNVSLSEATYRANLLAARGIAPVTVISNNSTGTGTGTGTEVITGAMNSLPISHSAVLSFTHGFSSSGVETSDPNSKSTMSVLNNVTIKDANDQTIAANDKNGAPAVSRIATVSDFASWSGREDAMLILAAQEVGWPQGERKVSKWEELIRKSRNENDLPYLPAMLSGKIFLKRLREVANALRFVPVQPKITEIPVSIVPKVKAKVIVKLNVMVLRAIQRWGYPRKIYDELSKILESQREANDIEKVDVLIPVDRENARGQQMVLDRSSYLLSWEVFANYCGMKDERTENDPEGSASLSRIQEIVAAMINAKGTGSGNDSSSSSSINSSSSGSSTLPVLSAGSGFTDGVAEGTGGGGEAVADGLLAGLNVRVIEQTIEKSDLLHRLRMTLACHTDEEITHCFKVRFCRLLLLLSLALLSYYFSSFLLYCSFLHRFVLLTFIFFVGCLID